MTLARALRVLDLHAAADPTEVKQAYLDLVRVWHPDRFQRDARLREKATGRLAEINTAYALLSAHSRTAASQRAWGVRDPRTMRTNTRPRPVAVQSPTNRKQPPSVARVAVVVAVLTMAAASVLSLATDSRLSAATSRTLEPAGAVIVVASSADPAAAVRTHAAPARLNPAVMAMPMASVTSPFSRDVDRTLARSRAGWTGDGANIDGVLVVESR